MKVVIMKYELKQLNINMGESEYEMPQAENFVITMVKEAKDAIISSAELCEKMLIHNQVSQWREWPDQNETRSDGISL
ncbi:MAG: hypothetical protein RR255_05405 [Bacilli bacterium]